jgi:hypothetical protein
VTDMALSNYLNKIIERNLENRAQEIDPYLYPRVNVNPSFAQRKRAADVPSSQIIVWLTIYDGASVRRKRIITSRAVRTGR